MVTKKAVALVLQALMIVGLAAISFSPTASRASSPFCGATLWMVPWNLGADAPLHGSHSADYMLELYAEGKRDIAARVTMITDSDAYSVTVPAVTLQTLAGETDKVVAPIHVRFETAQTVKYAFVDGVGLDGADVADCPSDVQDVIPYSGSGQPHMGFHAQTIAAKFLQALPQLTCGKVYTEPRITKDNGSIVGHYGNAPRETTVHIYLDSNGTVLRTSIEKSSGVEGLDLAALGAARVSEFAPATFLCTPVVSELFMTYTYTSGSGE